MRVGVPGGDGVENGPGRAKQFCSCLWLFLLLAEMGEHLVKHGDGVKDVAFEVEDCDFIVQVGSPSTPSHTAPQNSEGRQEGLGMSPLGPGELWQDRISLLLSRKPRSVVLWW